MTEQQRLFLSQAQSGFRVFNILRRDGNVHPCHTLHYLQMTTELLGKAYAWRNGPPPRSSHKAFRQFFRDLSSNPNAQRLLGYEGQNAKWDDIIRKSAPLVADVEKLAPVLARDGPNPEYPWPPLMPHTAPAEYQFQIWRDLRDKPAGRQFLQFLFDIFESAGNFL